MGTVICAGKLWTGEGPLQEDAALYFTGERIKDIGPRDEVITRHPGALVLGKSDWLVTPAFIDAHDHGRGVSPVAFGAADRALEQWIPTLGRVRSSAYMAALYDGLLLASSGVSTVLHSHNPSSWGNMTEELVETARGYNEAGIRVILCPPYVDQNNQIYYRRKEFADRLPQELREEFLSGISDCPFSLSEYFRIVETLRQQLSYSISTGMVSLQLHPAGLQWCSDETLLAMQAYAQEHDLGIHMHMLETKYQKIYSQKWGMSSVEHLDHLGLLTPRLSLAHMVWAEESDWALLAKRGVKVVTNPSSNLRLRSGVMPLQTALEAGVVCAVGLDGCGLDDDQDYLRELRLARFNPSRSGVGAGISPAQMLTMGTAAGAAVARGEGGVLRKGSWADFVCLDYNRLCHPFAAPAADPLELLAVRGTRAAVDRVYVAGECIVRNGRPCASMSLEEGGARLNETLSALIDPDSGPSVSEALVEAVGQFYKRSEAEGSFQ